MNYLKEIAELKKKRAEVEELRDDIIQILKLPRREFCKTKDGCTIPMTFNEYLSWQDKLIGALDWQTKRPAELNTLIKNTEAKYRTERIAAYEENTFSDYDIFITIRRRGSISGELL